MNYTDFKNLVAAYMNRTAGSFVVGSIDILDNAINRAKRDGQLVHKFDSLRTEGYLLTGREGAAISGMKTTKGGATALAVNMVVRGWELDDDGAKYMVLDPTTMEQEDRVSLDTSIVRWYQKGDKLYVTGYENPTWFLFDVYKWLPDYSGTHTTDIFTEYYDSWLLLRSVYNLNFFLKEDQRVQISMGALQDAWNGVLGRENNLFVNHGLD